MMLMVVDCLPDKLPTVVNFLGLQELCSDELCPQLVERHKLAILHVGHAELGFRHVGTGSSVEVRYYSCVAGALEALIVLEVVKILP